MIQRPFAACSGDESNSAEVKIHTLNIVGTALLFRSKLGGREMMEESLALTRKHHQDEHAARVYTNLAEYGVETRDLELAEQGCLHDARTIAEGVLKLDQLRLRSAIAG